MFYLNVVFVAWFSSFRFTEGYDNMIQTHVQ